MKTISKQILITGATVFLTCVSNFAAARCPSDLRGVWQSYGFLLAGAQYYSCTFSTARDGTLETGSVCDVSDSVTGESLFPGGVPAEGQYTVDDSCNVTGGLERITGYGEETLVFNMFRID